MQKKYPELTPYQFASNKPIWALDQDGKEMWYYYNNLLGWTPSKLFKSMVWTEEGANRLGYYSAMQIHKIQEQQANDRAKGELDSRYEDLYSASYEVAKTQNLFGLLYEMSPVKGLYNVSEAYESGHPYLAATLTALAITDFSPLFNTTGKAYGAVAKGIAESFSIAKTWELHPLIRGMLLEAKMAGRYASKGFEWLAETFPFFRKIDFYNATTETAISLKTVDAKGNFDFKNILKNIDELAELRAGGSTAQFGRELTVKNVELHVGIPEGYDKNVLKAVEEHAKNQKITLEIKVIKDE